MGTPAQDVEILISTTSQETLVVLPEGCLSSDPSNCGSLRGSEFIINSSTTWAYNGLFALTIDANLDYSGNAEYGFDTVALGWQGGSGGPSLKHQIVGGIAAKDYFLGLFGLTPRPTNFTTFDDPQTSFIHNLRNQSLIPSNTYGYTAGAQYSKLSTLLRLQKHR